MDINPYPNKAGFFLSRYISSYKERYSAFCYLLSALKDKFLIGPFIQNFLNFLNFSKCSKKLKKFSLKLLKYLSRIRVKDTEETNDIISNNNGLKNRFCH